MKRILTWFIIAAMLAVCLCGCSGSKTETEAGTGTGDTLENTEGAITVTDLDEKTQTIDEPLDKVIVQWSGAGGPFIPMSAFFGKDVYKHIAAMDITLQKNRADMWENYLNKKCTRVSTPLSLSLNRNQINVTLPSCTLQLIPEVPREDREERC